MINTITRRAALVGAIASSAAIAVTTSRATAQNSKPGKFAGADIQRIADVFAIEPIDRWHLVVHFKSGSAGALCNDDAALRRLSPLAADLRETVDEHDAYEITALLMAHERAWNIYGDAISALDDHRALGLSKALAALERARDRASQRENFAMQKLLAYVPRTVGELQLKLTHLARFDTWDDDGTGGSEALFASILKMVA
ncbi:MAG: hypothetical protein ABIQ30_07470 [Devosia sp.]